MINAIQNVRQNVHNAWALLSNCRKFAYGLTTVGIPAALYTIGAAVWASKTNPASLAPPLYNCVSNNICTFTGSFYFELAVLGIGITTMGSVVTGTVLAYPMIWRPAKAANPLLLPAGFFQPPLALLPAADDGPIN